MNAIKQDLIKMKKALITGGTGFLGKKLSKRLQEEGYEITVFTRNPSKVKNKDLVGIKYLRWDFTSPALWENELNEHEIIIHLAGANIFGRRWDEEYKKKIIQSREISTKNIVKAIRRQNSSVKLLITASGINYYGETAGIGVDDSAPPGDDFLAEVCKRWEASTHPADEKGIRRINMRMAPIFSTREGYLRKIVPYYKFFIGGPLGSGRNWLSWIHIEDVVESYIQVINNPELSGPVNISSPNPVTMREFASALGEVLKRPSIFTVPETALKILVGEGGRYVSYSQRVFPQKLIKCGFRFSYPELKTALYDIIENKK